MPVTSPPTASHTYALPAASLIAACSAADHDIVNLGALSATTIGKIREALRQAGQPLATPLYPDQPPGTIGAPFGAGIYAGEHQPHGEAPVYLVLVKGAAKQSVSHFPTVAEHIQIKRNLRGLLQRTRTEFGWAWTYEGEPYSVQRLPIPPRRSFVVIR